MLVADLTALVPDPITDPVFRDMADAHEQVTAPTGPHLPVDDHAGLPAEAGSAALVTSPMQANCHIG
ncbi:hypothetical protein [Nonomuraea jiangxiensis]|uniref:hypothetical protein n=1 Tax=Nonomuraea jiangxiensis TaxID=633440 RepID=UPI0015A27621|nr:hypothetical protein [Nonomuraea jiangxiensis]